MVNSTEMVGIGLGPYRNRPVTREDEHDGRPAGGAVIQIPAEILDEMIAHAVAGLPDEACGLLGGVDGRGERFYPMRNADRSATTYRLDPKEQLEVFNEIEDKGWELLG